jgi:hypothetical protein
VLPTFLVIGAMKAGTTSLWAYLASHPEIHMSPKKEVNFFSEHGNWERGVAWYERHFAGAGNAKAVGEASPTYTLPRLSQPTPERIARTLPDVRLVYVVRHPIDRIVSHYRQAAVHWGHEGTIDEMVRDKAGAYVGASRYARRIDRYLEHVPRERMHVIVSEELYANRDRELGRLFDFLGVPTTVPPAATEDEHNSAADRRQTSGVIARLRETRAYGRLRPLVPAGVRDRLWRTASKPAVLPPGADVLSPETERWVLAELAPDLERLKHHLGPAFDCWGLA